MYLPDDQALHGRRARCKVRAIPKEAGVATENGDLSFVDNAIDISTGTIQLKATFSNEKPHALARAVRRCRARPEQPAQRAAGALRSRAKRAARHLRVRRQADITVESRPVAVGRTVEGYMVVQGGLAAGRDGRHGRPTAALARRQGEGEVVNITEIFIRRPVMTTLVMIGIVLFGVAGYRALPVSDLPNVDFPTIQVTASLPGASPETMAASVATPLERQFSTIAGLDSMNSIELRADLPASPCSSRWTARSTPPRRTCSRPSPPPAAPAAGHARRRPPIRRSTPPTSPSSISRVNSRHAAALRRGRVRRDADRRSASP